MDALQQTLLDESILVLMLFACQLLPFAIYIFLSKRLPVSVKLTVFAAYAATLLVFTRRNSTATEVLLAAAGALTYFFSVSLGVYALRRRRGLASASPAFVFITIAAAFVMVPALVVPDARSIDAQLLGWDLMFATYSYWVDSTSLERDGVRLALTDYLFFILVNPVYVIRERGERHGEPRLTRTALVRTMGGALIVLLGRFTMISTLWAITRSFPGGTAALATVSLICVRAVTRYAGASGLASVRIGLMAMLGHSI